MGDSPLVQGESPYKTLCPIVLAENIRNIKTWIWNTLCDFYNV